MRIVLDTNVLVSAMFFRGPPHRILKAWRDGRIQLVVSPEILKEYERVAIELSRKFPGVDALSILQLVVSHAEVMQPPRWTRQVCEDPDDDKFLNCAAAAGVSHVITGDKLLLKVRAFGKAQIVTPRQFVDRFL